MSDTTVISTGDAPASAYTFSQGIKKGNMLAVSGQGAMDPTTNEYVARGDVRRQTRRTLANVKAILEAGGATVGDVLMFRVYLTTRDDFAAMNDVYDEFITENVPSDQLPCRTTVFVGLPHEDMLVEIDALAVTG
ncbi:RidA family protein [Rhodococcus sp. NPDC049939]|uniref:RidA family protein n=1 Tax=Rhodococcus sp. NPDC049939 TaxID=3155511 RepID=UPI00340B800D